MNSVRCVLHTNNCLLNLHSLLLLKIHKLFLFQASQDDIEKSFGGGPSKSFYSGAYSSSTNAYMLMYRQADSSRNVSAIKPTEFPEHIKVCLQNTFLFVSFNFNWKCYQPHP